MLRSPAADRKLTRENILPPPPPPPPRYLWLGTVIPQDMNVAAQLTKLMVQVLGMLSLPASLPGQILCSWQAHA